MKTCLATVLVQEVFKRANVEHQIKVYHWARAYRRAQEAPNITHQEAAVRAHRRVSHRPAQPGLFVPKKGVDFDSMERLIKLE